MGIAKKKDEKKKVETKKPSKDSKDVYHISQNKDDKADHFKEWRVRKEGSDKTIKFFTTQKEAIDFANSLIKNNQGSIKIHKLDGKMRK